MDLVQANSNLNFSRKLETYLRKEALLHFISDEKEILDAGCGTGTTAVYLAKKGRLVTGVDISGANIERAMRFAKEFSVSIDFKLGDIEDIALPDNSLDLIICEEALEHVNNPLMVLRKFIRLLRKKGKLILSVPNAQSLRWRLLKILGLSKGDTNPEHLHQFSSYSINNLLSEAGFENIRISSDFIPLPGFPFNFFLEIRKRLARRRPSLSHHLIICAEKNYSEVP
jgi:ubiquinone biosynthesis O-methyltransferase